MVRCTGRRTERSIGYPFRCLRERTGRMDSPSIQSHQIVFILLPGLEPPENMEMGEGFFSHKMGAKPGSRCSRRIATFTTLPLIRQTPTSSMRPALNRQPGDRQTAGCTGSVFPDLTSNGDTG